MTSASFALHCMICFEAFDLKEHAPVVLPCGHTYLCLSCSNRLEKCMECRTSLFRAPTSNPIALSPPGKMTVYRNSPTPYSGRNSPSLRLTPTTPVRTTEKPERLPTPKNHVLIDLIESSIYAEKRQQEEEHGDDRSESSSQADAQLDQGIRQLSGKCGTYVVREPLGLVVEFPPEEFLVSDPCDKENQTCGLMEEELSCRDEQSFEISPPDSFDGNDDVKAEGGLRLHYGQTVQVVNFEDNVAILARGRGKVRATSDQLVKVGVAKDRACQVEGSLYLVRKEKEEMERKLREIEAKERYLRSDLALAKSVPFKNPYAMVPEMLVPQHRQDSAASLVESSENTLSERASNRSAPPPVTNSSITGTAPAPRLIIEAPNSAASSSRLFCMSMPEPGFDMAENALALPNLGSFGDLGTDGLLAHHQTISSSPARVGGINFRTGLSGHSALTSSSGSSYTSRQEQTRRNIRLMGEHRGIAKIKPMTSNH